tara:strand:- start:621 stop:761 length:141 start_codon:yes stop_codon:yes gene_type:complete
MWAPPKYTDLFTFDAKYTDLYSMSTAKAQKNKNIFEPVFDKSGYLG